MLYLFAFSDATSSDQPDLLCKKLKQCCVIFNFMDSIEDLQVCI